MFDVVESILTSNSYFHDYVTTLYYSTSDTEIDDCEEDLDEPSTDSDYDEEDVEQPIFENFSLSYMKRAIEYYDDIDQKTDKQKHSWKSVKHQFRRIPHQYYLTRFRGYVEEGGTKKQKVDSVESFDFQTQIWYILSQNYKGQSSIQQKTVLNSQIYVFSQFVTKREVTSEKEIKKSVDQFVSDVRALIPKYEDFILNTDQSGFELEMHSTLTLSHQGEENYSINRSFY